MLNTTSRYTASTARQIHLRVRVTTGIILSLPSRQKSVHLVVFVYSIPILNSIKMNCPSCQLELTHSHDTLECMNFAVCGNKYHFSCLSAGNKSYKKSLITSLCDIQNLLWFCDECLPNITGAFVSNDNEEQQQKSQHTQQAIQSQQTQETQISPEQSNSLADLVSFTPTISNDSTHKTTSMDIDENPRESLESIQFCSNGKRRRLTDSGITESQSSNLSDLVSSKVSSTNYRCIYLTKFKPLTVELDIIKYINTRNRDSAEVMECKKLLPEKCNVKKLSFVSFKLTVHKEFYDIYIDQSFWPLGITANEFIMRPPKNHSKPQTHSQSKSKSKQFRVNPFAVRKPKQNSQVPISNKRPKQANSNNNRPNFKSNPNLNRQKFVNRQNDYTSKSTFRRNDQNKFNVISKPNQKNNRAQFNSQSKRQQFHRTAHHSPNQTHHRSNQAMSQKELGLLNQMVNQLSNLLNRF